MGDLERLRQDFRADERLRQEATELLPYESDLKSLGWSKAELCRRMGLSKDAPRRWKAGPPRYVQEYLRVCLLLKQALEG